MKIGKGVFVAILFIAISCGTKSALSAPKATQPDNIVSVGKFGDIYLLKTSADKLNVSHLSPLTMSHGYALAVYGCPTIDLTAEWASCRVQSLASLPIPQEDLRLQGTTTVSLENWNTMLIVEVERDNKTGNGTVFLTVYSRAKGKHLALLQARHKIP